MITAQCDSCSKTYQVKSSLVGKRAKCKSCGAIFTIDESHGQQSPVNIGDIDLSEIPTSYLNQVQPLESATSSPTAFDRPVQHQARPAKKQNQRRFNVQIFAWIGGGVGVVGVLLVLMYVVPWGTVGNALNNATGPAARPASVDWFSPMAIHHKSKVHNVRFHEDGNHISAVSDGEFTTLTIGKAAASNHVSIPIFKCVLEGGRAFLTSRSIREKKKVTGQEWLVWDSQTGKEIAAIDAEKTLDLSKIVISQDLRVMGFSVNGAIVIQDAATGAQIQSIPAHPPFALSPNGRVFAASTNTPNSYRGEHSIGVWEVATGTKLHELDAGGKGVIQISFSGNGDKLAAYLVEGYLGVINLWNVDDGTLLHSWEEVSPLRGRENDLRRPAFTFSSGGKTIATRHRDGVSRLGDSDKYWTEVWDVQSLTKLAEIDKRTGYVGVFDSIQLSPDGKTLATTSFGDHIGLWDVSTGEEKHKILAQDSRITSLDFSPDSKLLASGHENGTARIWDVAAGTDAVSDRVHAGTIVALAFAPNSELLASLGGKGGVMLWNRQTGELVHAIEKESFEHPAKSIAFSQDGKTLAVGTGYMPTEDAEAGGFIEFVNVTDPSKAQTPRPAIEGFGSTVQALAFAPDGDTFAATSKDKTKLLDWRTGKVITEFDVPSSDDPVDIELQQSLGPWRMGLAFSPDGTRLAVADGFRHFTWDLQSVKQAERTNYVWPHKKVDDSTHFPHISSPISRNFHGVSIRY